jgi:chemotaxis protein methyltransferase CheR
MIDKFVSSIIDISDEEFNKISGLVYEKFGINLSVAKRELVKGRLNKLLRQLGFKNFSEYYDYVIKDDSKKSLLQMVDKISTNHTYFYRESDHFEYLINDIIPQIIYKKNELRIWCAGCATGEEAYTLAMIIKEYFGTDIVNYDIGILATDISITALNKALEGIYPVERTVKLPENLRKKYFTMIKKDELKINKEISDMVLFKRLNLMQDIFPFKGKFDIVFCRNVMIYFDNNTRMILIKKLHDIMNDFSYLFIGHSESLLKETALFKYIKPAVYLKC